MTWTSKSGKEIDPRVYRRLQTFFDRLLEAYPDREVIHFNRDFKKLAERGTELRRLAGYGEDNDAFFEDFGFRYVNALRRQAESHGTYEELVERLRAAYPDGIVNLYEAEPFRADLSYFARKKRRTAKHILRQAGVLRDRKDLKGQPSDIEEDFTSVEPIAEPVTEPVAEPVAEPTVEPVAESVAEPEADPSEARRAELRLALEEQSAQLRTLRGIKGMFGKGAKQKKSLSASIEQIRAELKDLGE